MTTLYKTSISGLLKGNINPDIKRVLKIWLAVFIEYEFNFLALACFNGGKSHFLLPFLAVA